MRIETVTRETDFFAGILAAIDSDQLPETERKTESLVDKLNSMIGCGITFEVGENDFEVTGEGLSESEQDFLTINKTSILCTLQQALLVKHFFSRSELLSEFTFEVIESQAIRAESSDVISGEIYFDSVREVSAKWFMRLLQ